MASSTTLPPRVVVVSRPTTFEHVLARWGTVGQAQFFLRQQGLDLDVLRHDEVHQRDALQQVAAAIPAAWRRASVDRDNLDRFLFEPADIIVAVGQDGLVANVAKYLDGQPVIGIAPVHTGVLVPHLPNKAAALLRAVDGNTAKFQPRTMVEVSVDRGAPLRALNEVFIGHRSHQSARYTVCVDGCAEVRHASSGLIVSTGTGSTGWARSIHASRRCDFALPTPTAPELAYFARETFPSPTSSCDLSEALVQHEVTVTSQMESGGVIFGDGLEADRIEFDWGRRAIIRRADVSLQLVAP